MTHSGHHPDGIGRMKRQYFAYLAEARGHSEQTIDGGAKAIDRFEAYTRYKDFKAFHIDQAKGFKHSLADQRGSRSGEPLSKATLYATLTALKRFFIWLARQPGYKSRSDAEYFNLSVKETRIAKTTRPARVPTLEQIRHGIQSMPATTDIERRDRALIAFTILTGARDGAIASFKLRHIDMAEGKIDQDAREVQTKFSKSFVTAFFPMGDDRIRSSTDERKLLTGGPPFHIMPEIIHLYLVLCERGIVLLNQNFAEVERPPAHFDVCGGSERLDSHHRQIRVDAAVEEIEIKGARHATPRNQGLHKHIQHRTPAAQATARVDVRFGSLADIS
jgi:hypothetical protein